MSAFLKVEHLTQHYADKKAKKLILDELSFELSTDMKEEAYS